MNEPHISIGAWIIAIIILLSLTALFAWGIHGILGLLITAYGVSKVIAGVSVWLGIGMVTTLLAQYGKLHKLLKGD